MVSNFRYYSFKQLNLHGRVPFMLAVVVMLAVALIVIHPPVILSLGFTLYGLSGPVWTLVRLRQRRSVRRAARRAGGGSQDGGAPGG
jgi:CDP-diacylglycerol--serine O-phosphatidyltransferase